MRHRETSRARCCSSRALFISGATIPRLRNCAPLKRTLCNTRPLQTTSRIRRRSLHGQITLCTTPHLSPSDGIPSREKAVEAAPRPRRLWLTRWVLLVALCVCGAMLLRRADLSGVYDGAVGFIERVGVVRGAAVLSLLNFCTVLFCFPANMGLMIAAGAVLGSGPAFLALHVSKTLAACAAFALGRGALYPRVERQLERIPRLARLLKKQGSAADWRFVLLMRLSPFPGFMLNYLLSLTGVSFAQYAVATALGIAPSVANLVLMGSAARDIGDRVAHAGAGAAHSWLSTAVRLVCALSMLAITVIFTRNARRAFAEDDDDEEPPLDTTDVQASQEDSAVALANGSVVSAPCPSQV